MARALVPRVASCEQHTAPYHRAQRAKDHSDQRVLDARAKTVLLAMSNEPRGRALEAYLRVMGKRQKL